MSLYNQASLTKQSNLLKTSRLKPHGKINIHDSEYNLYYYEVTLSAEPCCMVGLLNGQTGTDPEGSKVIESRVLVFEMNANICLL